MNKNAILFLAILSKVIILFLYPSVISDVGYYYEQSNKILLGFLPYTDFKFEYPPLATVPIWFAGLLSKKFSGIHYDAYLKYYRFIFFSLDLGLLLYWKSQFENQRFYRRLLLANIVTSMALGPLLYDRLDLLFGMIVMASLLAIYQKKKMQGLSFAILGIPFKLISLIFVPLIGISFWKDKDFNIQNFMKWVGYPSILLLILLIGTFKFNFLNFLSYHHHRGIQIESTWATIEFLIQHFKGAPLALEYNYGAQHLKNVSPWLVILANYSVIFVLGILFLKYLFFKADLSQILLTSLIVFVTFGKVLSPQFFIWFIPLIFFFVDSEIELAFFSMICLLSAPIIFNYGDLINQKNWAWWCMTERNLLLMGWTFVRFQKLIQLSNLIIPWKKSHPVSGLAITPE